MSFKCIHCGLLHPPLQPGEKCSIVPQKDDQGNEIDFNILFVPLRNILISQLQQKTIKEPKKLFGAVIVEITKFLETYEEK